MEIRRGVMVRDSFIACGMTEDELPPDALAELEDFRSYLEQKGPGANTAKTFDEWKAKRFGTTRRGESDD